MNSNLNFRIKRFRAYVLGDLDVATEVFRHDVDASVAIGQSHFDATKSAKLQSANGVSSWGIGSVAFLMFCAIDSRWVAPKWAEASMAWFSLALAGAIMFSWYYYGVVGQKCWRRSWYRFTGDPQIEDFSKPISIGPLKDMLWRWKILVRLAGMAGSLFLISSMLLIRFASMQWSDLIYWASMPVIAAAAYWPTIYINTINQAYHQMMAARLMGD